MVLVILTILAPDYGTVINPNTLYAMFVLIIWLSHDVYDNISITNFLLCQEFDSIWPDALSCFSVGVCYWRASGSRITSLSCAGVIVHLRFNIVMIVKVIINLVVTPTLLYYSINCINFFLYYYSYIIMNRVVKYSLIVKLWFVTRSWEKT